MKKLLAKISGGLAVIGGAFALSANYVHAAADVSLTSAMASSTSFFTDNINALLGFIIDIIFKFGGYALAIGVVSFVVFKLVHLVRSR